MRAELVMIGTELLLGEIVDTNAAKMALALRGIGVDIYYKTTVGDNEDRITEVLDLALDRSDAIITSGGLGPTVDDMTRQCVASATGRPLVYSDELELQIAARFRKFGREMAENNKRQANIPDGAVALENPVGTAPCFLSEDISGRGFVIVLPGVPRELEYMLENAVIPILTNRMGGAKVTRVRVLRTCAVGESSVDRVIGDLMTGSNPTVGLAAHIGQTDVRITAKADNEVEAQRLIDEMETEIRGRLGVSIYGVDKETVVNVVGAKLRERGLKLSVVDTITNGQIGRDFIESGFEDVLASNETLDIDQQVSLSEGRSEEWIVKTLAERRADGSTIGLALIGPLSDNATYVSVHGGGIDITHKSRNYQDSDHIRRWLVTQSLDWVRRGILGQLVSPAD